MPDGPPDILGVVNAGRRVVRGANMRRTFHLRERDIELNDQLILAETSSRPLGLLVDAVSGVMEFGADSVTSVEDIVDGVRHLEDAVKTEENIIPLHSLAGLTPSEEADLLDARASQPPQSGDGCRDTHSPAVRS